MIKPKDAIRCRSCGYRIMYKARTKRGKRIKGMARLFVTQFRVSDRVLSVHVPYRGGFISD